MFAMMASFVLSRTLVPTMAKYLLADHNAPHGHAHNAATAESASAEKPLSTPKRKYPTPEEIYALANRSAEENALAGDGGVAHFAERVPDPLDTAPVGFFSRIQKGFEHGFERFRDSYKELLERALEKRAAFVSIFLACALASGGLFYFNGQEFFPEIKSGTLQMHLRAPLGTRMETAGRIASLVSNDIERLLPGQIEGVISNCGLPVGPHNIGLYPDPHDRPSGLRPDDRIEK